MTKSEVLQWIADIFEEPLNNIKLETLKDEIPAWDSLGVLTLMAGFDEEFDFLLTEDETAGLVKVEDIINVLSKHGCIN